MNGNMGSMNRVVGTSSQCYFCNDYIASTQLLQNHVKQCGSILEKCHNGCGSWIERKHMVSHVRQCRSKSSAPDYNKTLPTRASLYSSGSEDRSRDIKLFSVSENVDVMKKDMEVLRLNLTDEIIQRENLKNEVEKMRRQYALSEERNQILVTTLTTLRKTTEEDLYNQQRLISEMRDEMNHFNVRYQNFNEFISRIELRLDSLQKLVDFERNERSHLELIVNSQDGKIRNVYKLEADLEEMKHEKSINTIPKSDQTFLLEQELRDLKNLVSQESLSTKQHLQDYKSFQNEIETKIQAAANTSFALEKINHEMKTLKISLEEESSTIGMIEKNMNTLSTKVGFLQKEPNPKLDLAEAISTSPKIADTSGHLLWRIDYYHQKMKDAIDNGTILSSPIFLSSKYGYTLQAEVNLNGIGKWKGRHLTATVYILSGEFDPVLEWPATLQADIILKDQTPKKTHAIDIVKTLSLKMKVDSSEDKSKNLPGSDNYTSDANGRRQYIFIPHTSLDKLDYIKNNVMFMEIIVQKPK